MLAGILLTASLASTAFTQDVYRLVGFNDGCARLSGRRKVLIDENSMWSLNGDRRDDVDHETRPSFVTADGTITNKERPLFVNADGTIYFGDKERSSELAMFSPEGYEDRSKVPFGEEIRLLNDLSNEFLYICDKDALVRQSTSGGAATCESYIKVELYGEQDDFREWSFTVKSKECDAIHGGPIFHNGDSLTTIGDATNDNVFKFEIRGDSVLSDRESYLDFGFSNRLNLADSNQCRPQEDGQRFKWEAALTGRARYLQYNGRDDGYVCSDDPEKFIYWGGARLAGQDAPRKVCERPRDLKFLVYNA